MLRGILISLAACFFSVVLIETAEVKTLEGNGYRQSDLFPSTHWSVIVAAGRSQADPEITHAALAELCQRKIYARVDRQKGRFRSFLLASLKNFLADAFDRDRTLKRGGGQNFLPLHEEQVEEAESLFQTHGAMSSEDQIFDRSWAEALVTAGLERLSADYKDESKEKLFNELRIFLTSGAEPLPAYAELAVRLGMTESTLRSHVTRLRARYREALRAEVRRTVDTEAEVGEELHELLRVLTRG